MDPIDILLVEDEAEILSGLQLSLQSVEQPIRNVYAASSAEEALEHAQRHKPAVIVTDIVLPNLTGLELVSQLKQVPGYHPKILVISGFSDFQYAQRSIQLGVVDYLLKPFPKEDFCGKIASLIELIHEEEREKDRLTRQQELASLGTQTLRNKFLLNCLEQRTPLQETVYHRLQFWNLEWLALTAYTVMALTKQEQRNSGLGPEETELQDFVIRNITEEVAANFPQSLVIQNDDRLNMLITAHEEPEAIANAVRSQLIAYQRIPVVFGVSQRMASFHLMHDAYTQAAKACRLAVLNPHNPIVPYAELDIYAEDNGEQLKERFIRAVVMNNREGIALGMEPIFRNMILKKLDNPRDIFKKSMEMVIDLHVRLREAARAGLEQIPMSLWENLERDENLDTIQGVVVDYFQGLANRIAPASSNAVIQQAKSYIAERFANEITLQALADHLSIHPVWLSQLFKKETGQNFLDYVTELRIEKAKQLLRETNLKVYEICTELGYQNLQHFGMMFKKRTGLTPKEFRYGR